MKSKERDALLAGLQARFNDNLARHPEIAWPQVRARLLDSPAALRSLLAMETSGGEPDVIGLDAAADRIVFCDCSAESPVGRRSLCYDRAAWDARKANKPAGSAQEMSDQMGIAILNEQQYHHLQTLGVFDVKTSSWLDTPSDVRSLGGALFGDRRFGRVFVYHNGAESYYAVRGFRGRLLV